MPRRTEVVAVTGSSTRKKTQHKKGTQGGNDSNKERWREKRWGWVGGGVSTCRHKKAQRNKQKSQKRKTHLLSLKKEKALGTRHDQTRQATTTTPMIFQPSVCCVIGGPVTFETERCLAPQVITDAVEEQYRMCIRYHDDPLDNNNCLKSLFEVRVVHNSK